MKFQDPKLFFLNGAQWKDKLKATGLLNLPADNFANSLDPDQVRQNVGPDLDPNYLTLWWSQILRE